jgi:hypothetical protein
LGLAFPHRSADWRAYTNSTMVRPLCFAGDRIPRLWAVSLQPIHHLAIHPRGRGARDSTAAALDTHPSHSLCTHPSRSPLSFTEVRQSPCIPVGVPRVFPLLFSLVGMISGCERSPPLHGDTERSLHCMHAITLFTMHAHTSTPIRTGTRSGSTRREPRNGGSCIRDGVHTVRPIQQHNNDSSDPSHSPTLLLLLSLLYSLTLLLPLRPRSSHSGAHLA